MKAKFNVLLVDDHSVVRAGYKAYLSTLDQIGNIYEAERGEIACQLYQQFLPHVVILDLSMPGIGGLETIRRLMSRDPDCKILVFSIYNDLIYVTRAIKAGAKGYIPKTSSPETLITAVRQVASGYSFIDPQIAQQLAVYNAAKKLDDTSILQALSPREFDVFCLLAQGMTTHDAAGKLCLSYKTVCNHATSIKDKLGIKTLAEFSLLAVRQGVVDSVNPNSQDA